MTGDRTDSKAGNPGLEAARARLAERVSTIEADSTACLAQANRLTEECRVMGRQIDGLVDAFNTDLDRAGSDLDAQTGELVAARDALAETIRNGEDRVAQLNRSIFFLRLRRGAPALVILAILAAVIAALLVFETRSGIAVSGLGSVLGVGGLG